MAALSPAHENAVSLWLAIILAALLALALAALITSPPRTDSPPAEGAGAEATGHVVCPQAPGGLTRSGMRGRSRYARACAR
jgi:hypothetical protein